MQIRVAIIAVIVWAEQDMMNVSTSASTTLKNLKTYSLDTITAEMKIFKDNVQLVTWV